MATATGVCYTDPVSRALAFHRAKRDKKSRSRTGTMALGGGREDITVAPFQQEDSAMGLPNGLYHLAICTKDIKTIRLARR